MFVSTGVKVQTGVQGLDSFSPRLHASSFRRRVDGLSTFDKALPRFVRRGTTPRCPLSGCLWSVVCRVRTVRLATALLMPGGVIPSSTGRLLVFVGFRQPEIIRQVSFSVAFSFFAWVERSHTGQAYSEDE